MWMTEIFYLNKVDGIPGETRGDPSGSAFKGLSIEALEMHWR